MMITFKIIRKILSAKGFSFFDSALITAIKQILAQYPDAGPDTTLSSNA
ncbi:MAG: hypothetical protein WC748_09230 [Legionellales bacterium]|jgi:hypothetical protein